MIEGASLKKLCVGKGNFQGLDNPYKVYRSTNGVRHVGAEADAGSIREVLVTRERTSDGTVLRHVMLDSLYGAEAVRCAGLLLVITVCRQERRLTKRERAKEQRVLRTWARRTLGNQRHVMSGWSQRVRPITRSRAVVRVISSSGDASVHEPLPRLPWLTPVASHGETRGETQPTSTWCHP